MISYYDNFLIAWPIRIWSSECRLEPESYTSKPEYKVSFILGKGFDVCSFPPDHEPFPHVTEIRNTWVHWTLKPSSTCPAPCLQCCFIKVALDVNLLGNLVQTLVKEHCITWIGAGCPHFARFSALSVMSDKGHFHTSLNLCFQRLGCFPVLHS